MPLRVGEKEVPAGRVFTTASLEMVDYPNPFSSPKGRDFSRLYTAPMPIEFVAHPFGVCDFIHIWHQFNQVELWPTWTL